MKSTKAESLITQLRHPRLLIRAVHVHNPGNYVHVVYLYIVLALHRVTAGVQVNADASADIRLWFVHKIIYLLILEHPFRPAPAFYGDKRLLLGCCVIFFAEVKRLQRHTSF